MKHFMLFILLALSMSISAQLKPKIAIGYDIKNNIRMTNIYGDKMTYYMPNFNFRSGLEYAYKDVSIYYDMQFWCKYENKHTSFSPEQGVFEVGIKYNVTDKIKITINHVCYHPLQTSGYSHNGIYGGHKGITISYGY